MIWLTQPVPGLRYLPFTAWKGVAAAGLLGFGLGGGSTPGNAPVDAVSGSLAHFIADMGVDVLQLHQGKFLFRLSAPHLPRREITVTMVVKKGGLCMATIRCPHCGSPVMVRGNRWECGWCGDFGNISSLFPSEQAKLAPKKSTPKITLSFTVSVEDTTPPPRHFTRTELVDMVRRWDFSENEWACRELLIADFPDAVRRWTVEELEDMDTQELLYETGDSDPQTAVQMMKLLLDTAESHLQEPEVAEQLLGWDMCDLCGNQFVQASLLKQLKQDDRLARQIFQSAYVGDAQEDLLDACDWFGEAELKKHLYSLLTQNPFFEGFD